MIYNTMEQLLQSHSRNKKRRRRRKENGINTHTKTPMECVRLHINNISTGKVTLHSLKKEKQGGKAKGPSSAEDAQAEVSRGFVVNPSGVRFVKNPAKDNYRSRKIVWVDGIATKAPKSAGK